VILFGLLDCGVGFIECCCRAHERDDGAWMSVWSNVNKGMEAVLSYFEVFMYACMSYQYPIQ
jgi:hypothetical protein